MKPLGKHHVVELMNCSPRLLNKAGDLEKVFIDGIQKAGLGLVTISSYKFEPVGVTVFAIISESHIAIHTYPESCHASLDIFTCTGTKEAHMKLLRYIKSKLRPKQTRMVEISRGNPLEVTQENWLTSYSSYAMEVRYHIKKRLYHKRSKFQDIRIIENEHFGRMLFLDKDLQIADSDIEHYDVSLVKPITKVKKTLKSVAILGGGDGGILRELLKYSPKKAYLVDIDKEVIDASRKHLPHICEDAFEKQNVRLVYDDVNNFLTSPPEIFDAIIYDLTMHPEAHMKVDRDKYLRMLFKKIKNALSRSGILTMQVGSEHDQESIKLTKKILRPYFQDLTFTTYFIPSFCENWVFAAAKVRL